MGRLYRKRVAKDCQFTREEIDEFYADLYGVNTTFKCCNAAPVIWVAGYQRHQAREFHKEHGSIDDVGYRLDCL